MPLREAAGRPATARDQGRSSLCSQQQTCLPERTGQKGVRHRQLSDLRVQHRYVDAGSAVAGSARKTSAAPPAAAPATD